MFITHNLFCLMPFEFESTNFTENLICRKHWYLNALRNCNQIFSLSKLFKKNVI